MPKVRISLSALVALSLCASTAHASPYASSVRIVAAPGYAAPGEPAPAPVATPAPQPYGQPQGQPQGQPAPQPYGQPQGQPAPQPYGDPQPYAQPQPYPAQSQPYQPPPRRRGKGMMIAGWTIFGASYLTTALIGAAIYDANGRVCDDVVGGTGCHRAGLVLFVPVVGPLIGIRDLRGDGSDSTATGTLAGVFSFLAQSAGLALGIAGATLWVRDGRRQRAGQQQAGLHLGRGVHLQSAPRRGGGTLNLSYRF
ncbi:hypothetical protein [Nannocystis sp.]|uniref:hypothetical protein n=1 Tax=Nannocystis sp. TaxID=1962667 RepID=UPI0025DD06A7|nr:hypothetical protein [Nannocystis sp.]MBK7824020.1 hypothetical protein [Nannocystis sp.]